MTAWESMRVLLVQKRHVTVHAAATLTHSLVFADRTLHQLATLAQARIGRAKLMTGAADCGGKGILPKHNMLAGQLLEHDNDGKRGVVLHSKHRHKQRWCTLAMKGLSPLCGGLGVTLLAAALKRLPI